MSIDNWLNSENILMCHENEVNIEFRNAGRLRY